MRNLKRVLSLALALVMVLGMMVIGTSAATFTDEESITYKEAVEVMSGLGILKGYQAADGTYSFNPTGTLERDEAAKIIAYVAMGADVDEYLAPTTPYFTDIADSWAAKYINVLVNLKVVDGNGDGTYNPDGKLTVAQFAKMLLLAAGVEGTFTGAEWKANVKEAFNEQAELVATGLKITEEDPYITREEACHMALAAMKVGTEKIEYYVLDDANNNQKPDENEEVIAIYDNIRDAALDAQLFNIDYIKVPTKANLLKDLHGVSYVSDTDDFGRPGDSYNWVVGNTPVKMFYADAPVATFEGPVTEEALFAAAKVTTKGAKSFSYTLIEENTVNQNWDDEAGALVNGGKFSAAKAGEATAKWTAAGTGNGIKSELYKEMVGTTAVYTLVSVREFLGTVTVNEIDPKVEDDTRTITVALSRAGQNITTVEYETEEFAKDDKVIVTIADTDDGFAIQTIALAEAVEGKVTKITDKGVYTIADKEYVLSQNWGGTTIQLSGTTGGSWYVDSMGNLIGDKQAPNPPADVWYYGVVLGVGGQGYVPADATDLLGSVSAQGKDAKEVIKVLKADGTVETFDTVLTITKTQGVVTKVTFVNDAAQTDCARNNSFNYDADIKSGLVKYTLKDGKIAKIVAVDGEGNDATGGKGSNLTINENDATLGSSTTEFVNDKTLFIVTDNTDTVFYTGYKNIPEGGLEASAYEYFYAVKTVAGQAQVDKTSVEVVYVTVSDVDVDVVPTWGLVWYASTDKYTTKVGTATITTYTNVYLDGVKGEISFKGNHFAPVAGTLYYYDLDEDGYAFTPYNAANGNEGKLDVTATILRIEDGYYVSEHSSVPVVYVDEDTKYFQVNALTGAVTEVEGLPAIDVTGATTIEQISLDWTTENNYQDMSAEKPAEIVYFAVKEVPAVE